MKNLAVLALIPSVLILMPNSVEACGDSYIIEPSGRCTDLTETMRQPLRSVAGQKVNRTPQTVSVPQTRTYTPIPTPKPTAPSGRPNVVETPPELQRL